MVKREKYRQYSFSSFPVTIDPLLPVVIVLMAWILSVRYFPELIFTPVESVYWLMGIASSLFLTISIFVHEVGHALMAKRMRLPLERIHLFLFGGMAELKRRPVIPRQELLIALAGPAASFLFAFVSLAIAMSLPNGFDELYLIFQYVFYMNLLLGAFNLLPIFPLDGGRALRAILWRRHILFHRASLMTLRVSAIVIIFLFIVTGLSAIFLKPAFTLWFGLLSIYLLYTAWTGRKELIYEPDLDDLIFEFDNIDDTESVIREVADIGSGYMESCTFPVTEEGRMQHVAEGRFFADKDSFLKSIRDFDLGDFIDVNNPQTFQENVTYSSEFVPVVENGLVTGLCDAHELRFWLQEKQNAVHGIL